MDFADEIIFIAYTPQGLEEIFNATHTVRQSVGLNMCLGKTEFMFNRHTILSLVIVDRKAIEDLDSYVYL